MAVANATYREEQLRLTDGVVRYLRGGDGPPLVLLHHSIGNYGWGPVHERLAESFTVYAPDLPGFGGSTRPDWARDVRDLAIAMNLALDALGLTDVTLVGFGFGGWVAAEMATMNQVRLRQLVLAGAAGIQPREGHIADQLVIDYVDYVRIGFSDRSAFEAHFGDDPSVATRTLLYGGREMAMRVTWKPWMFRRSLPFLLRDVRVPALVLWGADDQIIPLDAGRQYAEALPRATLVVLDDAGHFLDFERSERIVAEIVRHGAAVPA